MELRGDMALSRRELNIARRGKRGSRVSFALNSNAQTVQSGQPRGGTDHGTVLVGVCQFTDMRASESPSFNTMRNRKQGGSIQFKAGASVAYEYRITQDRNEKW